MKFSKLEIRGYWSTAIGQGYAFSIDAKNLPDDERRTTGGISAAYGTIVYETEKGTQAAFDELKAAMIARYEEDLRLGQQKLQRCKDLTLPIRLVVAPSSADGPPRTEP